jgi:hypothetical protein
MIDPDAFYDQRSITRRSFLSILVTRLYDLLFAFLYTSFDERKECFIYMSEVTYVTIPNKKNIPYQKLQ